jgi:hypothetical protein
MSHARSVRPWLQEVGICSVHDRKQHAHGAHREHEKMEPDDLLSERR